MNPWSNFLQLPTAIIIPPPDFFRLARRPFSRQAVSPFLPFIVQASHQATCKRPVRPVCTCTCSAPDYPVKRHFTTCVSKWDSHPKGAARHSHPTENTSKWSRPFSHTTLTLDRGFLLPVLGKTRLGMTHLSRAAAFDKCPAVLRIE